PRPREAETRASLCVTCSSRRDSKGRIVWNGEPLTASLSPHGAGRSSGVPSPPRRGRGRGEGDVLLRKRGFDASFRAQEGPEGEQAEGESADVRPDGDAGDLAVAGDRERAGEELHQKPEAEVQEGRDVEEHRPEEDREHRQDLR